ncbi:MAG TPA: alginate export family protein [Bryobacteraceae bacterium]|jgi:hypothetical protein|nr:alginate export family protein [Bryobacteraceae bacterium]
MKTHLIGVVCAFVCLAPAWAQSNDASQPLQIGGVTFSGSVRERPEFWDWFGGKGQNTYAFSGTLVQFAFSQTTSNFEWKIDMAAPILLGLPNHAVEPSPQGQLGFGGSYFANNTTGRNAAMIFPKQAYVRFKGEHSSLQLGRFEFADGMEMMPTDPTLVALKRDRIQQRLIGIFGYSEIERSFDGGDLSYTKGPWNLTAAGAIPTRGVYQVDGWGWVRTPFTYVSATREVHHSKGNAAEWRLFGIYYEDPRGVLKTDNRAVAVRTADHSDIRIGTYGGHYIQAIESRAGTVDLLAWGALQTGAWGTQAQRSGAFSTEAGFQPNIAKPIRPWFRGGYYYGSGDGNAKDGIHGTFFAPLPTPRIYARFPFFNEMNNRDGFGEVILRPAKKVTTRSDVHHLSLANANDLWYTGGGAYQPWTFGFTGRPSNGKTGLANLYDSSVDYAFTRAASVSFYYGYAQGGDVIKAIYKNPNGQLGFVEFNYKF